jgi:hypothetical protein
MKVQSLKKKFMLLFVCFAMLFTISLLAGCSGDNGAVGASGTAGQDLTAGAKAETCTLCHADAFAPPVEIHPNLDANIDPAPYAAVINDVNVAVSGATTTFTIDFDVTSGAGAYVPTLANRANPDATGKASSNLAYLRFGYAKLITNPAVPGETRWVSYNQSERAFANLTDNGGGNYTYVCSALTATTGATVYDPAATTRIGLQISTAASDHLRLRS